MIMLLLIALATPARVPAKAPVKAPVVVSALTTSSLIAQCRGKDRDPTANFCTGYILGAFDTLSLTRQICPSPRRASNIEVIAAARKYLRNHADKSDVAPSFLVRDALRAAFPCKRG